MLSQQTMKRLSEVIITFALRVAEELKPGNIRESFPSSCSCQRTQLGWETL